MQALKELYSLINISQTEGSVTGICKLDPKHDVFLGHFPNNPVLPGVVQLDIVRSLLEKVVGSNISTKEIKDVKYLKVINPDQDKELKLNFTYSIVDGDIKVKGFITDSNNVSLMKISSVYSV
jgi:3-hydroxyacyl-[acyl-carrier-protein] dehydratase